MRVLLLNQAFYPDVAATAQHAHDLAVDLVERGHEVTVVASRAIYGSKGADLPRREVVDGIQVRRVGGSLFGKGGTLARLVDFLLFYVLATWAVVRLPKQDVVVPFTTPPLIVVGAVVAGWVKGHRTVYWVMDLYPEVAEAHGMMKPGGVMAGVLRGVSRWACKRCAAVVALGRCMKRRLIEHGVDEDKIEIIRVWADKRELSPMAAEANGLRREWGLDRQFVVMYSGNFGLAHEADTIIAAIDALYEEEGLAFVFVGSGKALAKLREHVAEREMERVRIEGYQPRERLSESLNVGDVHLIAQTDEMTGLIVPSKLFGVLAVGRPAVFVGPAESEVGRVIEEAGAGRVVQCGDTDGLVAALRELKADAANAAAMGAKGRAAFEAQYDRRIATGQWADVLERVAGAGKAEKLES
ncbi:MAG: glycosyltransferase family 4 protein [Planctomycetota bacterium]